MSDGKFPVELYKRSKLEYRQLADGQFTHNFERDLHLFILWENGRYKQKQVMEQLSEDYKILYCAEIKWSSRHIEANLNRLYRSEIASKNRKHEVVGGGPFLCIVVEDEEPEYGFSRSLDGTISMSNLNVVRAKHSLRSLLNGNFVHSSSCISEFFFQGTLLFHPELLQYIISLEVWDRETHILQQDLAGANGWESIEECITVANLCSDYVILRNFEYLPNNFWGNDSDIDLLCSDDKAMRAALNAQKRGWGIAAYQINVSGNSIPVDIRTLGDNYYDPLWQRDMLKRKVFHNQIIPRPSDEDYFFSLLYHCKLQKRTVKDKYVDILIELAKKIGLDLGPMTITDDELSARVIDGYLKGSGYYFTHPVDRGVFLNNDVYKYVTRRRDRSLFRKVFARLLRKIYSVVPVSVKQIIPSRVKVLFRSL